MRAHAIWSADEAHDLLGRCAWIEAGVVEHQRAVRTLADLSTVFTSNRSQAVRLPKPVALPPHVRQVEVVKVGRGRLILPLGESWDEFFDGPSASDDFMAERGQPPAQERDGL